MLIALVPVMNLVLIVMLRRGKVARVGLTGWSHAVASGVAAYYALLFLPFSPFAVVGLIVFGLGALPLAPLTALISGIVLRYRMRRLWPDDAARRLPGLWGGVGVAIILLMALEAPKFIAMVGIQMAADDNPAVQSQGLTLLRTVGNRDQYDQTPLVVIRAWA